jgi:hypothetical protein
MSGSELAAKHFGYVLWTLVDGADAMRASTVHSV